MKNIATSKRKNYSVPSIKRQLDIFSNFIVYKGKSMYPTLKDNDLLRVTPFDGQKIRIGDIIFYQHPHREDKIIHRVNGISFNKIKTRGDNNRINDLYYIGNNDIFGFVTSAHRGTKQKKIRGGLIGRLTALKAKVFRLAKLGIKIVFKRLYIRLLFTKATKRAITYIVKIRVISFTRPGGTEFQLLAGKHVLGRLLPGDTRWLIRPIFRIFIDEESLP